MNTSKKTAVAMSGGIDSTTVALLLMKEGHNVVGITGIMHDGMEKAADDAKKACEDIGIEHHVLDLRKEFNENVINYFENSYKNGLTPNPCTVCNRHIKWGSIADYAFEKLNADFYATGHYAKIIEENGNYKLFRGADAKKDQSYMLFALSQKQLSKTIFPLGEKHKAETREIAKENSLAALDNKESQDVCFICPPETVQSYLISKFGEQEGEIVDFETGKVLGKHKGAYNFTTGQRKGIGVAASAPLYVISVNPEENKILVGFKDLLSATEFDVENINWQQTEFAEKDEFISMVKIRYNSAAQEAVVKKTGENSVHVIFKEPKFAITSGQAAVFYDMNDEYVLCGGWIK
jgi:tRNA-specific 2-thiouridylase